ncbi:MAG: RNA-binding protein [Bacteroidia bacterium]|nr:RNA-binding protein [Bacteroidia bacterium]
MRLRVSSIDHTVTKTRLQEIFEEFGEIASLRFFRSVDAGSPALAFVEMKRERDAHIALNKLNGLLVGGAKLRVEISTDTFRSNSPVKPVPYDRDEEEEEEEEMEDEEQEEESEDVEDSYEDEVSIDDIADEY